MSDLYLPTRGLYCVATLMPGGSFSHNFFYSLDDARKLIAQRDANGFTVYIAQGTYRDSSSRKAANVVAMRSFFLDIDVGEKWKLKTQVEAARELKRFIDESGLPMPAVTNSGTGLYAHWPIAENIDPRQWKQIATYLKAVVAAYSEGLSGDSSRTADLASVLRPIGSHNRKNNVVRKVTAISHANEIPLLEFAAALKKAGDKRGVTFAKLAAPRGPKLNVNAEFEVSQNEILNPQLIAAKCAQIGHIAELKGNVEEPLWYAMVGLVRFATEGEKYVHQWSEGHPNYSYAETERKIQQHKDSGVGPTTCKWFHQLRPEGCVGCPHAPDLKTPLFLGRPAPIPLPNVDQETGEEIPPPPTGFKRTSNGVVFTEATDNGGIHDLIVYPYDIYPLFSARDEGLGYETVTWRHYLPHEGWKEFTMRSALVADAKAFTMALIDNHVHVPTAAQRTLMNAYAAGYLAKLQASRKMVKLHTQMGWKETESANPYFVLGDRIIRRDGVDQVGLAANVPDIIRHFSRSGRIDPWVAQTRIFNAPGMAPLAFAFLAAAFGAPLMRFTGFEGALISLVGPSGVAKTLTCRWALSAYGESRYLMMLKDDTFNGLVSRLGVYGNLPLVIDEVTNIDGLELSNIVYRITQGRDKVRLTRSARERDTLNQWNTVGVVTTNASLYDRLSSVKADTSAEVNRLFEYRVAPCDALTRDVTTQIYSVISENYGCVGEEYIKCLVRDVPNLSGRLKAMMDRVAQDSGALGEERFWTAVIAVAITGGVIAKSLGLIDFNVNSVYDWALNQLQRNRNVRMENTASAETLLARFIDEHASNRLVVSVDGTGRNAITTVISPPRGPLVMMQDISPNSPDRHLYISRPVIRRWLHKQGVDSDAITRELLDKGLVLATDRRKVLGKGTEYAGAQQYCWMVPVENTVVKETIGTVTKLEIKA